MPRPCADWSFTKFSTAILIGLMVLAVVCARPGTLPVSVPELQRADDGRFAEEAIVTQRIRAKNRIAQEVVAGRMPLVDAATLFGELNRLPPELDMNAAHASTWVRLRAPVRTAEERLCHQVINWIDTQLIGIPDRAEVVARLEAEYRAEQDKHGTIRLPDPTTLPPVSNWMEEDRTPGKQLPW